MAVEPADAAREENKATLENENESTDGEQQSAGEEVPSDASQPLSVPVDETVAGKNAEELSNESQPVVEEVEKEQEAATSNSDHPTTPPPEKKSRKKNWTAMTLSRPTLRPRKVDPPEESSTSQPKKAKKSNPKEIKEEKKPPTSEAQVDQMLPPELPLAESPVLQEECLPGEMPHLLSETSSSSETTRSESQGHTKKRRRTHFVHRKRKGQRREVSKERKVPSPSIAEGNINAACPESSSTVRDAAKPALCLCLKKPQVFVSNNNPGDLLCQAVDSMDGRVLGCCNPLDSTTVGLHRASTRTTYIMLCSVHLQRLYRHNCCPSCGQFCTQGKFLSCTRQHQYHEQCSKYQGCLHCGDQAPAKFINVTLKSRRDPIYLPKPRPVRVSKPAMMTVLRMQPKEADEPFPATLPPEVMGWTPSDEAPDPNKLAQLLGVACSALTSSSRFTQAAGHRYTPKQFLNAVRSGDAVKLLKMISSGFNPNYVFADLKQQTALHLSANIGNLTMVNLLLQAGVPIDLLDAEQYSALSIAILAGHVNVIKYLIRAGASLILKGSDGMSPLHLAAKNGNASVCSILLSAPSAPRRYVDCLDDGGWTPLVWASEFNHLEVVKLLLKEGANPSIRDVEQNIALHWAAFGGCENVVEVLLESGSDMLAVNVQGDTPMHIAARQGKYDVVLLLIARRALSDMKNSLGETPRDCSPPDSNIYRAIALHDELSEKITRFRTIGPKVLSNDISRGKERNQVQCVNGVDDSPEPRDFLYVSESCFTSRISVDRTISAMQSCMCEDNCTSGGCVCTSVSFKSWYNCEGRLNPEFNFSDPPMIFECNQMCSCNRILCQNRVVQNGVTCRFQLFRTATRGWGIKTLNFIPKGSYVCEYVGEIITDSEADHREDDSYLFDLENRDGETYCIDARKYGNVARFINHMCAPNVIPVSVFVEHQDLRFPRIAFFANQDIQPETELGYNYGEKFWVIKWKTFTCTCGSEKCMYSEHTIKTTLAQYQKKLMDLERMELAN